MTDELRFARIIDAPPEVVFDAFTSPGGQEAFYGVEDPGWIVESVCDLRVGGVWSVSFGPARHLHRTIGTATGSGSSTVHGGSFWTPPSSVRMVPGSTSPPSSPSAGRQAEPS